MMWLLAKLGWMALGAAALWVMQGIFQAGREHGAAGVEQPPVKLEQANDDAKQRLVLVLRRASRDPRADITTALERDRQRWN